MAWVADEILSMVDENMISPKVLHTTEGMIPTRISAMASVG